MHIEVNIEPLWAGKFADEVSHTKNSYQMTGGLEKTERELYGMDVYEQKKMPADQWRDIFFFPRSNAQLFVSCLDRPGVTIDTISPLSACKIVSNVDDHVRIVYRIGYSQMSELTQINDKLVGLVRSFMVN